MLPQKPAEEIKHPYPQDYGVGLYTTTRRANNLAGFFSAICGNSQFGRIEKKPEQQESGRKHLENFARSIPRNNGTTKLNGKNYEYSKKSEKQRFFYD